jgi:hypothetical protein
MHLARSPGELHSESAAERLDRGYFGCILKLRLLAPDIIYEALAGPQLAELGCAT